MVHSQSFFWSSVGKMKILGKSRKNDQLFGRLFPGWEIGRTELAVTSETVGTDKLFCVPTRHGKELFSWFYNKNDYYDIKKN